MVRTLVLFLALALSASAQTVSTVFALPAQSAVEGGHLTLALICVNDSPQPAVCEIAQQIRARLSGGTAGLPPQELLLQNLTGETHVAIAANSFVKVRYVLDIPAGIRGPVVLDIPDYNRVKFAVGGTEREAPAPAGIAAPAPGVAATPETPKSAVPVPPPTFGSFWTTRVTPYEPIYFLAGTSPSVEFQFSLKVQVLDFVWHQDPWDEIFLGYTQTSFWDLFTRDPYFYDTSYKPSVFYSKRLITLDTTSEPLTFAHQFGFEHESNGDGGIEERSLNTLYYQPLFTYGHQGGLQFTLQPRFWYYVSVGEYDKNLAAYRGYGDLKTSVAWKEYQLATKFEVGSAGKHPAVELDLMIDLHKWLGIDPAFQIQYFDGYGENLRDYDKIDHGLRAGFSLWYPGIDPH